MAGVLRSSTLNEILLALLPRVAADCGLDPSQVRVYAGDPDDCPHQGAEADVLLCPGAESTGNTYDGAGRYCDLRKQSVAVGVRNRLWLDSPDADFSLLTDRSLGHFALRDKVYDCVQLWLAQVASTQPGAQPGDMDGVSLPIDCGSWSAPRRSRAQKGWAVSSLDVTVPYQRTLTLPEIA